jgi:energy-coupling factor transporter ATP-binding protein EcfA2
MKLKTLNYAQHEGQPKQWRLSGLSLGNVNLLVGRNASGKSRTLNIIRALANLLSRTTKLAFTSGNYDAVFDNDGRTLEYNLHYEQNKVVSESLACEGKQLLKRGAGGVGEIWLEKKREMMDFQAPEDQLAAVARQDSIQHPYLAPLQQWAQSLYHYRFGTLRCSPCAGQIWGRIKLAFLCVAGPQMRQKGTGSAGEARPLLPPCRVPLSSSFLSALQA